MKIDVIISADYIDSESLKGKIAVVIDMLRATSVITTALSNRAKRVIPVVSVDDAFNKAEELKALGEEVLLGGERKALKIDGFDFSNSPLEYKRDIVEGKNVIMSTTNGTRALNLCSKADKVVVASVLNGQAVAKYLENEEKEVVFVNSGTNGEFSSDDFVCAGYIISELAKNKELELTDIAKTAKYVYESSKSIDEFIKDAKHYNILKNLGLEEDLKYCSTKNLIDSVFEFKNGEIKTVENNVKVTL
ncbi:2-phosphosulfolactate phosphatase family protein [Clostridium sp. LIBA-8841]|uniref:2-phosphosulfolactate phosphatase family protein n=1 Tax=Clostridium sp. LIBA-8841 TaxID=2987530 RepID=UPI002AC71243|nr:2-phosphosulfolactate phosphatase family protein [Clostridium sp. LIBA-8841]MDZ5254745.1 2-phosphosulfolactate phosphatase family protein [Clostridium sp. LIBA-8841]